MSNPPSSFQQARWNEPIILEQGSPGERGVIFGPVEPEIVAAVGDPAAELPAPLRREQAPALPELSQYQVLRHFLRLSQETMGVDVSVDVGLGTCTMKYSPRMHERLVRSPEVADLHPRQDVDDVQGILEVVHGFEQVMKGISGLDRFTFQPGGGAHGIYTNACVIRAYHESRGELEQRDEIITTVFSHPADAACPAAAGFKVITLFPDENGYPDPEALRAAVSERTAGLMITNPEDTGLFNPEIDRFCEIVHEAGGLCAYDQANANGLLGITRAREAGFDLCQFNLHKTFSAPHCAMGMACAAVGATAELARFLPVPAVELREGRYVLDYDRPESIGKVRSFHGVPATVLRAYAWVRSLGPDGLREVAEAAVLNNNYLRAKLAEIDGLEISFPGSPNPRLEQIRYSWEQLTEETGVTTDGLSRRSGDYGSTQFFSSHHPWLVPQPMTLEPAESFSKADLDGYAAGLARVAEEARTDPELVRSGPHSTAVARFDEAALDEPARRASTWRAFQRKRGGNGEQ
ncbi:MAG: aminomethyl-transferring glycine dehydrogenase subunit GcvPB [Solirubrobacterales bacterium]